MNPPSFPSPHRRRNPLTGSWVLVSAQRTDRPWRGKMERPDVPPVPRHDPACHLCPGALRATGERNPDYSGTYVFTNDFPAMLPDVIPERFASGDLFQAEVVAGTCRVVCFSPRHDLALSQMDEASIEAVVATWMEEAAALGAVYPSVQIFENRGAAMGASNPHPHGQIWANESLPTEVYKEHRAQNDYLQEAESCLLCDYLAQERAEGTRIVLENESFAALVPFWALWPFETMLLSKRHVPSLVHLDEAGRDALADVLKRLTCRYDNLFGVSFPYSMGLHQQPTDGGSHPAWHLHAHFYPPLLRSATVRKFMVGYELLAQPQRDLTAEAAASRLRDLPDERGF